MTNRERRRATRVTDADVQAIQLPSQEGEAFRTWITQTLGNTISNPTLESLEQAFHHLSGEYDRRRRGVSSWTQDLLHDAFLETLGTIVRLLVMLGKEAAKPKPHTHEQLREQLLGIDKTRSPLMDD